jgi:hypothetical protein
MGSSCSIVNDTESNVWIAHGLNYQFFVGAFELILPSGLRSDVVGNHSRCTIQEVRTKLHEVLKTIDDYEAEQKKYMSLPSGLRSDAVENRSGCVIQEVRTKLHEVLKTMVDNEEQKNDTSSPSILKSDAEGNNSWRTAIEEVFRKFHEKLKNMDEEQRNDLSNYGELIKPGEKYTWYGTLSLHMRVYVMNEKLQRDEKVCFTGLTDGSEKVHSISKNFKKLDVKTD